MLIIVPSFFEYQKESRRASRLLWLMFFAGVGLLFVSANLVLGFVLTFFHFYSAQEITPYALNSFFLLALIGGSAFSKWQELNADGPIGIVLGLGAKLLEPSLATEKEKKLLNVVEEMAIAASISVPEVFVLEREIGINAFAAGLAPSQAVLAVTRGALEFLNRDELQALVAHEFSHILNGDMNRNTKLLALLHGFFVLTNLGSWLIEPGKASDGRRQGTPFAAIGILFLIFGWLCQFWGKLVQASVARRQEDLADASAVQFTRNAKALVGVLSKIGGWNSLLSHPAILAYRHFFIASPISVKKLDLFSTHPPLLERIRKFMPGFREPFPLMESTTIQKLQDEIKNSQSSIKIFADEQRGKRKQLETIRLMDPEEISRKLAALPSLAGVQAARYFIHNLPASLDVALKDPYSTRAILAAALISKSEPSVALEQRTYFQKFENADFLKILDEAVEFLNKTSKGSLLSILDLSTPALRKLSKSQRQEFLAHIKALVAIDDQISLFEFIFSRILVQKLQLHRHRVADFYAIRPLLKDMAVLISGLAHFGNASDEKARSAFLAGAHYLGLSEKEFLSREEITLKVFDQSLRSMARASIPLQRKILEACIYTVASDSMINPDELELLRLLSVLFEAPMAKNLEEVTLIKEIA